MGYVRANISLENPRLPKLKPLVQNALVDTGALMLCLPEHIALQLGLEELEKREIITADGRKKLVPVCNLKSNSKNTEVILFIICVKKTIRTYGNRDFKSRITVLVTVSVTIKQKQASSVSPTATMNGQVGIDGGAKFG